MLQSIEGVYKHGSIELTEIPKNIEESRVIVTFLEAKSTPEKAQTTGVSGQKLLRFAGTIPLADVQLMSEAIEDCEQIDLNEW